MYSNPFNTIMLISNRPNIFRPLRDFRNCVHPDPPFKRWAIFNRPWRDESQGNATLSPSRKGHTLRFCPSGDTRLRLSRQGRPTTVCVVSRSECRDTRAEYYAGRYGARSSVQSRCFGTIDASSYLVQGSESLARLEVAD